MGDASTRSVTGPDGRVVGSDPDPSIRFALRRDDNTGRNGM
jgi:hypothetical protein